MIGEPPPARSPDRPATPRRAYDDATVAISGQAARQDPGRAEITRIEIDGHARGLLLRTPESIDWLRTSVELLHCPRGALPPSGPGRRQVNVGAARALHAE
jgi:hypothetical protein